MPKIIALAHAKGGSGASTVAVNLAAGIALAGKKTLLVDLDAVNVSSWALATTPPAQTLAEAFDFRRPYGPGLFSPSPVEGLEVVTGGDGMRAWDSRPERFAIELDRFFSHLRAWDIVLVDLPGTLQAITRGSLATLPGGRVLAPVCTRPADMVGFSVLQNIVRELRDQNSALKLIGIVPNLHNRTRLAAEVLEALRQAHGKKVLPAIRNSIVAAEALLDHKPIQMYAPESGVAKDFAALTDAVLTLCR